MSNRSRRNAIPFILVDGVLVEGVENVRTTMYNHFSSHFQARCANRPSMDGLHFRSLNLREGVDLIKPFSFEEVKNAVWDCDSFKSPGPDGISFGFVKEFWDVLKGDVMRFLVEFHRNGKFAKGINSMFIALIPKVDSPQGLNDFRPILLVNCMYKILSKVLANRLRSVIGSVVSDVQSAFIKGRQILDGILVANEVVDDARKRKKDLLLFKVDFEKAYDSVDWNYLEEVMVKMGFPNLWRKWIKECVGTARASVLVNGSPTDELSLHRGLRQGDPLSPFLFLLAAEGFHVLMEALVVNNLFNGYKVGSHDVLGVSHLQFANDTIILCDKSWANIRALRAILLLFQELSGLKVNFSKSLLVGINVHGSLLAETATVLNCKVGSIPFLYLGLPIGGNASRLVFWKPLINRINSRLSSWKSKHLSLGGRLVLLKSVLSSMPVYALSFFKAPSGEVGGLGVRRIKEFNLALLGKWCWRVLTERDSLWFRVLAARNGVEGGYLCSGGRNESVWWRSIGALRSEGWFRYHVSRSLGDGSSVLFWTDVWVGELSLRDRFSRLYDLSVLKGESVAMMRALGWEEEGEAWRWRRRLWAWEEELLGELRLLLQNVSLQVHRKDGWKWSADSTSCYTVQSAYKTLIAQVYFDHSVMSTSLWHKDVPLKVVLFAWRLFRDRLPTKDNLHRRHVLGVDAQFCVSGCGFVETSNHLFLHCNIFGSVWNYIF
ncbi:putative RNA-directed DNA polymerase [Medicago truncatula]|uniref:Putative RNA-directed DNA polymerase n=1 Tax=Medicago truncatula TaxID=3880 RepID=A0A396I328_MEDTR|nr:putative RNA-directed DNA polymerase [Medicago truncatula]